MTTRVIYQKIFNPQLLGASAQLIYQLAATPASLELRGARIRFINTSGTTANFTAYAVPNGTTPMSNNQFAANVPVAAGLFFDIDVPILSFGDAIWASCATGSVMVCQFMNGILVQ
jgi:hypothetical protein